MVKCLVWWVLECGEVLVVIGGGCSGLDGIGVGVWGFVVGQCFQFFLYLQWVVVVEVDFVFYGDYYFVFGDVVGWNWVCWQYVGCFVGWFDWYLGIGGDGEQQGGKQQNVYGQILEGYGGILFEQFELGVVGGEWIFCRGF